MWLMTTDSIYYLHDNILDRFCCMKDINPLVDSVLDNFHQFGLNIVPDTLNNKTYFITRYGEIYVSNRHNKQLSLLTDYNKDLSLLIGKADREGRIWIISESSIYLFEPGDSCIHRIENSAANPSSYFSHNLTGKCFCISSSGTVWIGTIGYGIIKFNPQAQKFNPYQGPPEEQSSISGFCEGGKDEIIVSVRGNVQSPVIFDLRQKKYIGTLLTGAAINDIKKGGQPFTGGIVKDKQGTYWLTIGNNLSSYKRGSPKVHFYDIKKETRALDAFFLYVNDYLWYVSDSVLYKFDMGSGKTIESFIIPGSSTYEGYRTVSALIDEHNGVFWLGTIKGLYRLDTHTRQWQHFGNNANDPHSLSSNTIFSILDDPRQPDKYIWVGTNGGGLNKLDKNSGKCIRYNTKNGLPNDVVYGILSDGKNRLWLSTNKGLTCLDPETGIFKNYTKEVGLQSNEYNRYAYLKTNSGLLFFGGVNGLNFFNPLDFDENAGPPSIAFTDFKVDNRSVSLKDKNSPLAHPLKSEDTVVLPWYENIVSFSFSVMDFSTPSMNKYRYKLEGVDKNWVDAGTKHEAGYTNLSPGKYNFYVSGCNSAGIWSNHFATLRFIITPPWWLTFTAKTIYALLIIGAIISFIAIRTNQLRRQNIVLERKVNERTLALNERTLKLNETLENLESANSVKNKLFSIISHDLRSPLAALKDSVYFLKRGNLTQEQTPAFANKLDISIQNTMNLLDNLLNWSLSQMKGQQLSPIKVNLKEIADENISLYNQVAEEKKIGMVNLLEDSPTAWADENIVRLVMRNLINNALKFSPSGTSIVISGKEEENNAIFKVEDEGMGIAPELISTLFEMGNKQKIRLGTGNEYGSGLGLGLCKELVEKSSGSICVDTTKGKGSAFIVTLPKENLTV